MRFKNALRAVAGSLLAIALHPHLAAETTAAASAQPQPAIAFHGAAIAVSGATPGGTVLLFGVTRDPLGYGAVTVRRALLQAADAGGRTTFTFSHPVATSSIYAAVDYMSGSYVVAAPAGYPLRLTTFPAKALRKHGNAYTALGLQRQELDLVCVRPRQGIWRIFLLDGSPLDQDTKPNGSTLVDAVALERMMGGGESIKDFHEHDVVIVLDSTSMDMMVSEVGK